MIPLGQGVVGNWRDPDVAFLRSFRLPSEADRCDPLALQNPLPRERRLAFDAAEHVYRVDGHVVPRSVTELVKAYSTEFDALRAASAMLASKWARPTDGSDEATASAEAIVAGWAAHGEVQRARGQLLHFQADQLLQGRPVLEPWSPELTQLAAIRRNVVEGSLGLRPFRTEVALCHMGLRLAGQIDFLAADAQGKLAIFDWKRSKELRLDCRFRSLKPPLEHLPDTNYWKYCLQLSLYAYMLESEYDLDVRGCYLGQVHPDLPRGRCIEVPRLSAEVDAIVEAEIACGRAGPPRPGEIAPWDC